MRLETDSIFIVMPVSVVDTADVYSDGVSEEIIGEFLKEHPEILVSSKAGSVRGSQPANTSRGHILNSLETSLHRLRRNHIGIWHIHRWDATTPIEELLAALDYAVNSGKVRYVGVSNFAAWQLTQAATIQLHSRSQAKMLQPKWSTHF